MMEWSKFKEIDGLTVLEDSDDAACTSDGFRMMPSKDATSYGMDNFGLLWSNANAQA